MKSDSNVKRKAVPAGLALFRKTAEHTGIFALVDLSYRLIAKDWMTEQEFEDWEEAVS